MQRGHYRELLFGDLALSKGLVPARDVANALQQFWESPDDDREGVADGLERVGALSAEARADLEAEVDRLITDAEGDPTVALARRGGLDRSIHTSMAPETSSALLREGAGARAPLRTLAEDRYRDFSLIGKGGMGVVYLTVDTELHREVAFKMVLPDPRATNETPAPTTPLDATPPSIEGAGDEDSARSFEELKIRFLQEAWVTGAMEHPGVVPVYELGKTDQGIPYYTMRYVKGERTLADAIKTADDIDSRLALLEPFLKVCDTVRYAHSRDVIHRDLKPANIALGEFGEVVVLDWGLSKMQGKPDIHASMWRARIAEYRDATDLSTVAGIMGTPGYMAPEAALGKGEDVDERSDVYSLGAILFEILTQRLPFEFKTYLEYVQAILENPAPPADELEPAVPKELAQMCARALAKKKEDRFASADDLAREVRRWQTEGRLALQLEALMEDATRELEAGRRLSGNMMLWHLDRASADCNKVLHLRKDHAGAQELLGEIKRLRERGIRERVRSDRRRVLHVAGFLILAVVAIATLYVAKVLADEREVAREQVLRAEGEAESSQRDAARAREEATHAREEVANAYAGLAQMHLKSGWVAAGRVAAARALETSPTVDAWRALAAADARWTPSLRAVFHDLKPRSLAWDPKRTHLLVGGADHRVRVVDVTTGKVQATLEGHQGPVSSLAVSDDGKHLATGSTLGRVKLWDANKHTFRYDVPRELQTGSANFSVGHQVVKGVAASSIVFDPRGRRVYVVYSDGGLRYWDTEDGGFAGASVTAGTGGCTALALGPQAKQAYVASVGGTVSLWPVDSGSDMASFQTTAQHVTGIAVGRDGTHFYAATLDQRVLLWDLEDATETLAFEGPGERANATLLSHDRRRFFSGDDQGRVRGWRIESSDLLARIEGFGSAVTAMAESRDGGFLAVAHADGTVRVWDLRMRWQVQDASTVTVILTRWDHDEAYLARPGGVIETWSLKHGRVIASRYHDVPIAAMTFDADGRRFFTAGLDGSIRMWMRGPNATRQGSLRVPDPVTALAAPGGQLVVGTLGGEIQCWDLQRKRRIPFDGGGGAPISALALAREGEVLVAGNAAGTVALWDLRTHEKTAEFELGGGAAIAAVAGDGEQVCAATDDGRIYRWSLANPDARERQNLPADRIPFHAEFVASGEIRWLDGVNRGGTWSARGINLGDVSDKHKPPQLLGSALPWVLKDSVRRLVDAENHSGLMLERFNVVAVPRHMYQPHTPRAAPWSK